jgi:hypothetical protein
MKTQTELATKWGVSRSLICKYHKAGMPLEPGKAEAWLHQHIPISKIHLNIADARAPLSPEPDIIVAGKLTPKATRDFIARLREFIADGAGEDTHPDHQTFCDGVRIVSDFGTF